MGLIGVQVCAIASLKQLTTVNKLESSSSLRAIIKLMCAINGLLAWANLDKWEEDASDG